MQTLLSIPKTNFNAINIFTTCHVNVRCIYKMYNEDIVIETPCYLGSTQKALSVSIETVFCFACNSNANIILFAELCIDIVMKKLVVLVYHVGYFADE